MREREVEIVREDAYTFRSANNARCYEHEVELGGYTTCYGVVIDGRPWLALGASGGGTIPHERSVLLVGDQMHLAIGEYIAAIDPAVPRLIWSLKGDYATCFGLHYAAAHEALICHGELTISRYTREGQLLWQSGGQDIFTGEFSLAEHAILAEDWNGQRYQFSYDTGEPV